MTYGYCRISTPAQSIDRQERNIKAVYPDAHIIREAYTGKTMNRPEWVKLMKHIQSGDVIVFDSVSRMARDADEGIDSYMALMEKGVDLVFLKEPAVNTETYKSALKDSVPMTGTAVDLILAGVNAYLRELARVQIRIAFDQAQKEVDDLRERTREGMVTAKLNGHEAGRKAGAVVETAKARAAKEVILKRSKAFGGDCTVDEILKLADISRNSYFKYVRELKEERGAV